MNSSENARRAVEFFAFLEQEIEYTLAKIPETTEAVTIPPYGIIYDLPLGKVVGFIFQTFGLLDQFAAVASSDNPQVALIEFAKVAEPKLDLRSNRLGTVILSYLVLMKNLESISLFHESLHQLLAKAAKGDDEALFKAVYIDPNILQASVVAQRIASASFHDDGEFFDRLSKSLTKTRPIRPRESLDAVRVMLAIVDECAGLKSVTDSELTDLATEFGHYPPDGDPLQAIKRQRQKYQKATSHQ